MIATNSSQIKHEWGSVKQKLVNCWDVDWSRVYLIALSINTGESVDTAGLLRDDRAPLMHMIAESAREKDRLHLITFI